ncbi:MAG TPA: DUF5054 domain-containing protein, partial [Acidimicrobiales bacterium]
EAVLAAHADLRDRMPGVEVRASTLDAFARALVVSGADDDLPVVTSEIGDAWIFGAATDPQKLAAFDTAQQLALRAAHEVAGTESERQAVLALRELLLVPEHTWGLDLKTWLPDETHWERADLAALRSTPEARHLESSWAEQRAYLGQAGAHLRDLPPPAGLPFRVAGWPYRPVSRPDLDVEGGGHRPLLTGERLVTPGWTVGIDPVTGAIDELINHRTEDRRLADASHQLAAVRYQTFDAADYERFYRQLVPVPADEWWARWDNTKPGLEHTTAESRWWQPEVVGSWVRTAASESTDERAIHHELVVQSRFTGEATDRFGAPPELWTRLRWDDAGTTFGMQVRWFAKPACRFPEATWCSFVPTVAAPESWRISKLGCDVSPLDVVRHGGRSLHGTDGPLTYSGPDGAFRLHTGSPSLVAPGRPNLLDADPPLPDLAGGMHVLLHDNCWGTNFPMWNEGDARFSFWLTLEGSRPPERRRTVG